MTTVPIAVLAAEIGTDVDKLAAFWADHVIIDDAGLRAVPTAVAKAHLDTLRAESEDLQARRAAGRARSRAQHRQSIADTRARRQAIAARDERLLAGDSTMSAIEVMLGADIEARLNARGRTNELLRQGISHGESCGPKGK